MSIIKHNKDNLLSTRLLVDSLNDHTYRESVEVISGATIGEHVRHILEFYVCLFRGTGDQVCYDDRERNHRIENDRNFALTVIDNLIVKLQEVKQDRSLSLKADYSFNGSDALMLSTSLYRELAYCLEHSVHHQALIKVAIRFVSENPLIGKDFGVAPSTIRHQKG